jgi:predicted DNA-binding WGR domain protein
MSSPAQIFFKNTATSKAVKRGERGLVFRSHHGAPTFLRDVQTALRKRRFWSDTPRLAVLLMDAIRGLYAAKPDDPADLSVEYDRSFYIETSSDRDAYFQVNVLPGQRAQIQSLFSEAIVWSGSFADYSSLDDGFFEQTFQDICCEGNDDDDERERAKPSAPAGQRYFEYRGGTSHKFWEVSRSGAALTTRYGRIGGQGQRTTKRFKSEELARREHEKLVAEKVRKGYVERRPPARVVQAVQAAVHDEPWRAAAVVSFDDEVFVTTDRTGDLLEKVKASIQQVGPPDDPREMSLCHHLVDNLRGVADMENCALQVKALKKCKFNVGLSSVRPARGVDLLVAFSKKQMTIKTFSGRSEKVVWKGDAGKFVKR